jgi:hypothetical protein
MPVGLQNFNEIQGNHVKCYVDLTQNDLHTNSRQPKVIINVEWDFSALVLKEYKQFCMNCLFLKPAMRNEYVQLFSNLL